MKKALKVSVAVACLLSGALRAEGVPGATYHFTLGKLLAEEGSFQEAEGSLRKAVQLAPEDPYVRLEYAKLLLKRAHLTASSGYREQDLDDAQQQLEKARQLAPTNIEVLRALGGLYLEQAQSDRDALGAAREVFEAIRLLAPGELPTMVSLGQIYLVEGEPDKAADVFLEILRHNPNSRQIYSMLVEALVRSEETERVEEVLAEYLVLFPDSLEARLRLSEMQSNRGDHAAAVATLQGAPPEILAETPLRERLASELYLSRDYDGAVAVSAELLQDEPEHRLGRIVRAMSLAAQARNREAIELLEELYREDLEADVADSTHVILTTKLAETLDREGRYREGVEVLEELIRRLEPGVQKDRVRYELGRLLAEREDWYGAMEAVRPVIENDEPNPHRLPALFLYCDALVESGRGEEALPLLQDGDAAAVAVRAKQAEVLFRLGRETAGWSIVDGLVSDGETPEALLAVAEVFQRLERYGDSQELLRRYLGLQPESVSGLFLLGAAQERSGEIVEAAETFHRLLRLDADFAPALNYLGYMWAEKGQNLQKALELVRRAVALEPDNGAYVDSLGWAYFQLGRYQEARVQLERAARLISNDAVIYEHLGDVYLALGHRDKARETYRRALKLDKENVDEVRRKLRDLEADTN